MNSHAISGRTKLVAIFGWPLSYTLSPRFQQAALRWAGVDAGYLALPAPDAPAFRALASGLMASPHFVGANVTNPYKVEALGLADQVSPEARAIGAANTLARAGARWKAFNTDAPGFLAAVRAAGGRIKGRRVLVLGAGGAARAVAWACGRAGAAEIAVLGEWKEQGRACAAVAGRRAWGEKLEPRTVALASQAAGLVVNCLPGNELGGEVATALSQARPGALAFDLSYLPRPRTAFLRVAAWQGWRTCDGLPMLLEQGRLSFQRWFGRKPPLALLENALRQGLR